MSADADCTELQRRFDERLELLTREIARLIRERDDGWDKADRQAEKINNIRGISTMMERTAHGMCESTVRSWAAQIREAIGDVEPDELPPNMPQVRNDP